MKGDTEYFFDNCHFLLFSYTNKDILGECPLSIVVVNEKYVRLKVMNETQIHVVKNESLSPFHY